MMAASVWIVAAFAAAGSMRAGFGPASVEAAADGADADGAPSCLDVLRIIDPSEVPATSAAQITALEPEVAALQASLQDWEGMLAALQAATPPDPKAIDAAQKGRDEAKQKLDHEAGRLAILRAFKKQIDAGAANEDVEREKSACNLLSVAIADELFPGLETEAANPTNRPEPRKKDIEPGRLSPAGAQGTPAQGQAAPSAQPVPQAGVAAAYVGTPAGPRLLTGITANPFGIVSAANGDAQQYALRSRLFDVGVLLPADLTGGDTAALGSIDYVGVRLRVNALSALAQRRLTTTIEEAYQGYQVSLATLVAQALHLLRSPELRTPEDRRDCFRALRSGKAAAIEASCKNPLPGLEPTREAERRAIAAVRAARRAVDSWYLGLDVSLDIGDPTFSELDTLSGQYFTAFASGGYRVPNQIFQVRVSAGADYTHLDESDTQRVSFAWRAGADFSVPPHGDELISVSGSVEGLHGPSSDTRDLGEGTRITGMAALSAPIYGGSRVAITFRKTHDADATIAVTADWASLLRALR